MTNIGTFERGNTFKVKTAWTSGSNDVAVDASSNICYLDWIDPQGNVIINDLSGSHSSTGIYQAYISTSASHNLGIWTASWRAMFQYGPTDWRWKEDKESIEIVYIK